MNKPMKLQFWIGHFDDEKICSEYIDENEDADVETIPLNKFCEEQGEMWYDHDHVEMVLTKATSDIKVLFDDGSYAASYKQAIYNDFSKIKVSGPMNFYISIFNEQFEKPRSVKGKGFWLHYLGEYSYKTGPDA
jgi:hypothetical protein